MADRSKLLWEQGNLYTGYPYGVLVTKPFGCVEYHGPFSTENEANTYGILLARESDGSEGFTLVKLETPMVRDIATANEVREHLATTERVPDSRPPA
jgi:hypothetical protein